MPIPSSQDGSGLISAGEFGHFMRLGESKEALTVEQRRALLAEQTRAAAQSMKADLRKKQLGTVMARTRQYQAQMAAFAAELARESGSRAHEPLPAHLEDVEDAAAGGDVQGVMLPPINSAARSEPSPRTKHIGGRSRVQMGGVKTAYSSVTPMPGQRSRMSLPPTRADQSPRGAGIPLRHVFGPL